MAKTIFFSSLKSLKKGVGSRFRSRFGSGSFSQCYGSVDPDPHQNFTDPNTAWWYTFAVTVLSYLTGMMLKSWCCVGLPRRISMTRHLKGCTCTVCSWRGPASTENPANWSSPDQRSAFAVKRKTFFSTKLTTWTCCNFVLKTQRNICHINFIFGIITKNILGVVWTDAGHLYLRHQHYSR